MEPLVLILTPASAALAWLAFEFRSARYLTAVSSALIAVVLSVPLTMMVVRISGTGSFGPALGTAAASIYPAWMASKLTVRAALTCP
jgi:hypothetical protein